MKRLFTANLARLLKSRVFYASAAVMTLLAVWNYWVSYMDMRAGYYTESLESRAFGPLPFAILLVSVFCGLFIGEEFGFGTMRNKLIAGYTKRQVYLSMLLISIAAGTFFLLLYYLVTLTVGAALLGSFTRSPEWILYCAFCMLLVVWSFCAVMTLVSMLLVNRAVSVTAGMLLAFGLIAAAAMLDSRLSEPEMIDHYILINEMGKPLEVQRQPNPRYLTGTAREIYQWADDILPTGQAIQISNISGEYPERWPFCALGVIAAVSCTGVALFSRRDIN